MKGAQMNSSTFKNHMIAGQQVKAKEKAAARQKYRPGPNDHDPMVMTRNVMEEDKMSEDISHSQRMRNEENELKNIQDVYRQEEPESSNVINMIKAGAKAKPGTATQQQFAPFAQHKGVFQDEIINTSKEVEGVSQKTIPEGHGDQSSNGNNEHADPNFRPQ